MREVTVCSDCHQEIPDHEDCPCWDSNPTAAARPAPVAARPMWDHPAVCGHSIRLDHPKPSRRHPWYCPACATLRRLTGAEPVYHPGAGQ